MDTTSSTLPANDTDEQRIRELVARSQEAQIDPDVLPALHTANLVIVNLAGRRLFGREAFTSAMTEALSSPLKDVRTSLEVDDIRFTTPDVAVVSLTKTVHDERSEAEGSSELPSVGAMTYVLTRQGDDWRIALAQTTPIR
ncbi:MULTISPECIES: SgcJ/EcaC family oxidoreductase [unclassified Streptomyces]|uniref:SgcJ/EcaC family oxidoreductase n=1 Tax=unclassified Streptomyces TaxID=2593676 RepID=UPI002DDAC02D|nr:MULTISPECIES: SgcJ/EcaC family oxidoreductase [unclassified Streptomyces]WSA94937.1 SgcJ/EcaC family oxidoreductase [Streptomyces sp. NBC_01795]WSB79357.1 SgcJ/EcaC family oxidoreductase [Streptomyces sp. NBC_01775]WSS12437.1 SgcJ/EcaC family oxidoreductase [Streptomyces sp. NBC_01186]WSS41224.1 SgcJ/EcaC family oxidoreductase [Streptomyces sp. NBC_01187]